ncbi:MAG: ArsA-related P-loop ATPase [Actinomycetota bacterium]
MDPSDFFTASRVLIVAGKGGVGKTTVSAALGVAASRAGIDTLLVEIEGKRGLATVFESSDEPVTDDHSALHYDGTELIAPDPDAGQGRLRARTIRADAALMDYLEEHGLRGFAKTLTRLQVLDTLATSTPGLKDLIVLGKIKQLETTRDADLIIVDAPASGHAIAFLRAAAGLQGTIDTGPIRRQADEVAAMLTDPERAQVLLVTLAEETPVNELVETAYALEDEVGISLGPAVVNGVFPEAVASTTTSRTSKVDPALASAAADATNHWLARAAGQQVQRDRLADELPLEQLTLSRRFATRLGREDLDELADELTEQLRSLRFGVTT